MMSFDETARAWFIGLSRSQQAEVRAAVDVIPSWMVRNTPVDDAGIWLDAQTPEHQADVRALVGNLPSWMVSSLAAASMPAISIRNDEWEGFMMPPALIEFLALPV